MNLPEVIKIAFILFLVVMTFGMVSTILSSDAVMMLITELYYGYQMP